MNNPTIPKHTSGPLQFSSDGEIHEASYPCRVTAVIRRELVETSDEESKANLRLYASADALFRFAELVVSQAHGDLMPMEFRDYVEQEARKVLAQASESWEPAVINAYLASRR